MAGVITLIKDDHKKLEAVFKQLEAEKGDTRKLLMEVAELLVPHSRAEEQVVYPAIKQATPEEGEMVDDGLAEHQHVEKTLNRLLAMDPDEPGADGLVAAMIGEVRHHVEEEEQDLLPKFGDEASNPELGELGDRFAAAKDKALADFRASL